MKARDCALSAQKSLAAEQAELNFNHKTIVMGE